jgi:hypothetical protein
MTLDELKPWEDRVVVLHLHDGEVTTARVDFVDSEYEDIIVTVLSSNRDYMRPDQQAFTIAAADVASIDPAKP